MPKRAGIGAVQWAADVERSPPSVCTLRSASDEVKQVSVDNIGVHSGHAMRKSGIDPELAVPQQLDGKPRAIAGLMQSYCALVPPIMPWRHQLSTIAGLISAPGRLKP